MAKSKSGNDDASAAKSKQNPASERNQSASKSDGAPQQRGTWRETIESVAIAFILAFLFRSFEAEAFVIPTGSMATTLMGRHKDLKCTKCGYWYQVSASEEVDRDTTTRRVIFDPRGPFAYTEPRVTVVAGVCPMCRFKQDTTRRAEEGDSYKERPDQDPAGTSYKGDRIIVVKSYNVLEPQRWDVFVFRYPVEAATNYIKRLVGLPEEVLRIHDNGDIYVRPLNSDDSAFQIARKPPDKILAMARDVYDNDYVVDEMTKLGWPPRWQPCPTDLPQLVAAGWPQRSDVWLWDRPPQSSWVTQDGYRTFQTDGKGQGPQWLRYQHFVPDERHWEAMSKGDSIRDAMRDPRWRLSPPAPLRIEDHLSYNDTWTADATFTGKNWQFPPISSGLGSRLPWVGDLVLECTLTGQGNGAAVLELIEGGRRFQCQLDFKSGDATLSIDGGKAPFETEAGKPGPTTLTAKGAVPTSGRFDVRFANVDSQLLLWIDDAVVPFDAPATYSFDNGTPHEFDHSPVGIASLGAPLQVERLRIKRDIFYGAEYRKPQLRGAVQSVTYATGEDGPGPLVIVSPNHGLDSSDHVQVSEVRGIGAANGTFIVDYLDNDRFVLVDTTGEGKYAGGGQWRRISDFVLFKDQFFALGDNSARSQDSRMWRDDRNPGRYVKYVHRDLLIGQAFFIFWPHSWDDPVPFTPNFPRMRFVR